MFSLTERQLDLNIVNDRKNRILNLKQLLKFQISEREKAVNKFTSVHGKKLDLQNSAGVNIFRSKWNELFTEFREVHDPTAKRNFGI